MLQKHIPSFYVQVTVHPDKLCIKQPTRCIKSNICHKTLHVSGIFCAHHQELSTVCTATGTFRASMKCTNCSAYSRWFLMMGTENT